MSRTARHAQVGLGVRSRPCWFALAGPHRERSDLAALGDTNAGRLTQRAMRANGQGFTPVVGSGDSLAALLDATRPDRVIVTTPDRSHDDVVVTAPGSPPTGPSPAVARCDRRTSWRPTS